MVTSTSLTLRGIQTLQTHCPYCNFALHLTVETLQIMLQLSPTGEFRCVNCATKVQFLPASLRDLVPSLGSYLTSENTQNTITVSCPACQETLHFTWEGLRTIVLINAKGTFQCPYCDIGLALNFDELDTLTRWFMQ